VVSNTFDKERNLDQNVGAGRNSSTIHLNVADDNGWVVDEGFGLKNDGSFVSELDRVIGWINKKRMRRTGGTLKLNNLFLSRGPVPILIRDNSNSSGSSNSVGNVSTEANEYLSNNLDFGVAFKVLVDAFGGAKTEVESSGVADKSVDCSGGDSVAFELTNITDDIRHGGRSLKLLGRKSLREQEILEVLPRTKVENSGEVAKRALERHKNVLSVERNALKQPAIVGERIAAQGWRGQLQHVLTVLRPIREASKSVIVADPP